MAPRDPAKGEPGVCGNPWEGVLGMSLCQLWRYRLLLEVVLGAREDGGGVGGGGGGGGGGEGNGGGEEEEEQGSEEPEGWAGRPGPRLVEVRAHRQVFRRDAPKCKISRVWRVVGRVGGVPEGGGSMGWWLVVVFCTIRVRSVKMHVFLCSMLQWTGDGATPPHATSPHPTPLHRTAPNRVCTKITKKLAKACPTRSPAAAAAAAAGAGTDEISRYRAAAERVFLELSDHLRNAEDGLLAGELSG